MTPIPATTSDSVPSWAGWLMRWPGTGFAFLWGFAEGTLFFVLPDVLLSLTALFRPRRALAQMGGIVAGAVLAGAVMFTWASGGSGARAAVGRVPLVSPLMFGRASADFRQFGIWGVCMGPLRGVPYKVYAVEAPAHFTLWPFLFVTIPARLWRLLAMWMGFAAAGATLRKLGRASLSPALHALFWVVTYVVYWAKVK